MHASDPLGLMMSSFNSVFNLSFTMLIDKYLKALTSPVKCQSRADLCVSREGFRLMILLQLSAGVGEAFSGNAIPLW